MNKTLILAIAALATASSAARAEISLGNGAIAFGLDAQISRTTNADPTELNDATDTISVVSPGVHYKKDDAELKVEAYLGIDVVRYDELDENDSEDLTASLDLSYPQSGGPVNWSLGLGYAESNSFQRGELEIVDVEEFTFDFAGSYYVSERTSLRSGIGYKNRESSSNTFNDVEILEIPFSVYYDYSDAMSVGVGYRLSQTESSGTIGGAGGDSEDHAGFIAVEHILSEILSYEAEFGLQSRSYDTGGINDRDSVYIDTSLNWKVTGVTSLTLAVGNDFSTSLADQSVETFTIDLDVSHEVTDRISLSGGITFEDAEYEQLGGDRDDEVFSYYVGASYTLIPRKLSLNGQIAYTDSDSSASVATYEAASGTIGISALF